METFSRPNHCLTSVSSERTFPFEGNGNTIIETSDFFNLLVRKDFPVWREWKPDPVYVHIRGVPMSERTFPFEGNGNVLSMDSYCSLSSVRKDFPVWREWKLRLFLGLFRFALFVSERTFPFEGNGNWLGMQVLGRCVHQTSERTFPFEGNGNINSSVRSSSATKSERTFPFEGNGNSLYSGYTCRWFQCPKGLSRLKGMETHGRFDNASTNSCISTSERTFPFEGNGNSLDVLFWHIKNRMGPKGLSRLKGMETHEIATVRIHTRRSKGLSRLKGMETWMYAQHLHPSLHCPKGLSRLKGMETISYEPFWPVDRVLVVKVSERTFPVEGNGNAALLINRNDSI